MEDSLDLQTTYGAILKAARQGQYISYGALAKANGESWSKVRYKLNDHLGDLMVLAVQREWPILSAIVVSQPNLDTGTLKGTALEGFIGAARQLGFEVGDPQAFVADQQQALFDWATEAPDDLALTVGEAGDALPVGGPKFVQYFGPVLDALRTLGGAAQPRSVMDAVGKLTGITAGQLEETTKSGQSKYENQIGWARFYLCKAGLIDGSVRGRWVLTTEGRETHLDQNAAVALFRDVYARFRHTASEDDEPEAPPEDSGEDLFDVPERRFWFVGALWGDDDRSEHFITEGIWQNGYDTKFADHVQRMKPGDRVAIKAAFTKKYDLPFENHGKSVSCMRIKAIGTITEGTQDGQTVKVDWTPLTVPKDWYFYTYRITIVEADASDGLARRLIQFAFGDHVQDYGFWLAQPYWAKKYLPSRATTIDAHAEEEDAETDVEEAYVRPYGVPDIIADGCFLSETQLSATLSRLATKKNLILQGPPGTGKTWLAKRLAYALIGTRDRRIARKRLRAIQFHPSLSYEDFVRGWRPDGNGELKLIDGVFLEAIEAARAERDRPFVTIIEEINRGNPAQVFGEMLTLLETDKRREDEAIELAYHSDARERVFIPDNLYVIGTMNIADRSLALVDLALRRRFAFVTLEPMLNDSWKDWCGQNAGLDDDTISRIQRLMMKLNDDIANDPTLGTQFRIGHSYVTPAQGEKIDDARIWFRQIVDTEISPLLEEYWFDSPDKASASTQRLLADS